MSHSLVFDWSVLAQHTTGQGTGGMLRQHLTDFCVEEVPAYLPSGTGEHLYLLLRKQGHTSAHVVRMLCQQLGLKDRAVGIAGLKDRHAVTTQWLSVPAKYEERLAQFSLAGVEILQTTRHPHKLGLGHLKGNLFKVRVRQATGQANRAEQLLTILSNTGVPNYFGPQRFGLGGLNASEGLRVLRGESQLTDPRLKRFLVGSVQSRLFNEWVSRRLQHGLFTAMLKGDMAKKHDSGGVFMVQDPQLDSQRAANNEISATGTLFGRKTKPLTLEAGQLEAEILTDFGLSVDTFRSLRGDRRLIRVFPSQSEIVAHEDGYTASFMLPKGSFATSVLRELLKTAVDLKELPDNTITQATPTNEAAQ